MILRRISNHLKDHSWMALGLDFFIVVVGILMAFQIESWAQEQNDIEKFERQLQLVKTELQENCERLNDRTEKIASRRENITELRSLLSNLELETTNHHLNELLLLSAGVSVVNINHEALDNLKSSELYIELANSELIQSIARWIVILETLERVHQDGLNYRDTILHQHYTKNLSYAAIFETSPELTNNYPIQPTRFMNSREKLASDPILENILVARLLTTNQDLQSIESLTKQTKQLIKMIEQQNQKL